MIERPIPAPEPMQRFEYFKPSGYNKFGFTKCPTCGKPPTPTNGTDVHNVAPQGIFHFRDMLSAEEYYISGMCQDCQDDVFEYTWKTDDEL
jgi:hypothetical protein